MVRLIRPGTFDLDSGKNLGAIELATFFGLVLMGLALSQAYTFFRRGREDRLSLKLLVTTLLLLEVLHSVTVCWGIYIETVTDKSINQANSYQLSSNALTENIITFVVQWFFCWRIYRLSNQFVLSGCCSVLATIRFIGGLVVSIESFLDVPKNPNGIFVFTFRWLITSALAVGAFADVLIAASMIFYLRQLSSPFNQKSTTVLLNRLVLWTLETGLMTSITSLAVIITFLASSSLVWLGMYIILAKLYSISLLVSLNNRPHKCGNEDIETIALSTIKFASPIVDRESLENLQHVDILLKRKAPPDIVLFTRV